METSRSRFAGPAGFGTGSYSRLRGLPVNVRPLLGLPVNVRRLVTAAVCLAAVFAVASTAGAAVRVVASIKPVHSLVAAVMLGAGEPQLIIDGTTSPHSFSLRPSDARNIQDAELIFIVGDALETSLAGSIDALARDAGVVRLADTDGLIRLPLRAGATFEAHDHDHEEPGDSESHEDQSFDMHIWLDPVNARTMVRAIAAELSAADAVNADTYAANAEAVLGRLDELLNEIDAGVDAVRGRAFIVFHDAYHYFEDRFGLIAAGSASVSPDRPPGARRIAELRERVSELGVVCVLTEPQFDPRIASVIIEGTPARLGAVDPLGAALDSGPDMYFMLMHDMAASFTDCLASGAP